MNKKQIKWDRSYLINKIADSNIEFSYLAKVLNISISVLINKLDGFTLFTIEEIKEIKRLFNLSVSEANSCFFNYN
ncbi:hypothetical protein [Gemelliphila palaticanis]|uniref:HTH cro/C1-type domain-containing protein n=1 Tax=Gemelliphila palaticanis TaxID=81950 RepID=A0ABX2SWQ4_9BACL|nr:hypothetical protein [Gemella palaticanis]MBF0714662.1 hypothetical protein [Gemella palaticanis]NYS46592.1 hypothetical protein [Gemella palaticanis]